MSGTGGGAGRSRVLSALPPPTITIVGTQSVVDGNDAVIKIDAGVNVPADMQVALSVNGDAIPWQDYAPFDPVITVPNGQQGVTITIKTIKHTSIEHDKRLIVSLAPSAAGVYNVAAISAAIVTVLGPYRCR